MLFADREYYETKYLMGRSPVIPLEQVEFWLTESSSAINFKNISDAELEALFTAISESTMNKLKRATCRIAEILYAAEQNAGTPGEGVKRSETAGAYSVSYDIQKRTGDEVQREIAGVARKSLANSELHNTFVWRG